jgi:hypothetical protein
LIPSCAITSAISQSGILIARIAFLQQKQSTRIFTDTAIRRLPDCATNRARRILRSVVSPWAITSSDADKLDALRRLDQFRPWHSLDEKRYCLVCGKIITGGQIELMGGRRGDGPQRVNCPTKGCHSIPFDWVLPTDEIMANLALLEAEASSTPAPHFDLWVREKSIASRLRKFAQRLKQSR